MSYNNQTITAAVVTVHGEPSVGIPDWSVEIGPLDLGLSFIAEDQTEEFCDELRSALQQVAKVITGEDNAEVFLEGYDERGQR